MSQKTLLERCRQYVECVVEDYPTGKERLLADIEAAIAQSDPWHEAILQACMTVEGCYQEADPAGSVRRLLDWHALTAQQAEPADEQAELKAAAKELEAMLFDTGPEESAPLIERQLWARGREERMDALRAALQTRGKNDSGVG